MRDNFQVWVDAVCGEVRFWPDREEIAKELRVHYEDHCKALERLSYEPDLAAERSLRALGSPLEVGRALDRVHRPWLGWLWVLSRVLAWGLGLCLLAAIVAEGGIRYPAGTAPALDAGIQKVDGETPAGHAEEVCTVAWPPPVRFGSYTVTVRQAACFHEEPAPAWDWEMVLWLEIHTPDIWLGPCDLTLLEAVDSRGVSAMTGAAATGRSGEMSASRALEHMTGPSRFAARTPYWSGWRSAMRPPAGPCGWS